MGHDELVRVPQAARPKLPLGVGYRRTTSRFDGSPRDRHAGWTDHQTGNFDVAPKEEKKHAQGQAAVRLPDDEDVIDLGTRHNQRGPFAREGLARFVQKRVDMQGHTEAGRFLDHPFDHHDALRHMPWQSKKGLTEEHSNAHWGSKGWHGVTRMLLWDARRLLTRKDFRAKIPALVFKMLLYSRLWVGKRPRLSPTGMGQHSFIWAFLLGSSLWVRPATAGPLLARAPETLAMVTPPTRPPAAAPPLAEPPAQPDFGLLPGQSLHAIFQTSLGSVDCGLAIDTAPHTVATFVALAEGRREWIDPRTGEHTFRPLYTGTVFHRIIPDFLIQGGDPSGTGTGGPGFTVPDENVATSVFDRAGVLGLATRGANTGGSQFFITAGPARHLDGRYTRLGMCGNTRVISAIATAPRNERNRPARDIILQSVQVVAR